MKAITCASYDYMKLMVSELRRQLEEIDSRNKNQTLKNDTNAPPKAPPRRQNPFNKPPAANLPSSSAISTTAGKKLILKLLFNILLFCSLVIAFLNHKNFNDWLMTHVNVILSAP